MTDQDNVLNLDEPHSPQTGSPLAPAAPADAPRASSVESLAREEPHLTDYLRMLYKRRWLAGTMFVLILVGTVVYNFTAIPIYSARTTILIDVQDPNVVDFKSVVNEDQTQADYYQTQYNLLQSRALARKTLDALHLWDNPYFNPPPKPQGLNIRTRLASVTDVITGWFRSRPVQVPDPDENEIQSRAIDAFLCAPRRLAHPQQPPRGREVRIAGSGARHPHRQRARHQLHRAEPRVQVHVARRRPRDWLGAAARRAAQAGRGKRGGAAAATASRTTRSRWRTAEHRRPEADGPERGRHPGQDRAASQKEALYNQLAAIQNDRAALDTLPGHPVEHVHPAAEGRARASCSASRRSSPTSSATSTPT